MKHISVQWLKVSKKKTKKQSSCKAASIQLVVQTELSKFGEQLPPFVCVFSTLRHVMSP